MTPLFEFQKHGSLFLQLNKFAMLADEMGVGKTPQAIDASRSLEDVLVICPSVAKYNWQKEFIKFADRPATVIEGKPVGRPPDTCVATFEHVTRHLDWYWQKRWAVIKVDEAHYLKNPDRLETGRTKSILGSNGLIHNTERLWALTGTPAPNHAGEIWVWLYVFGYTTLSYEGFIARYCNSHVTGGRYGRVQITGSNTKHTPELKTILKRMSLRRLKKDVLDLPPLFHNTYYIEGDTDAAIFKAHPELKEKMREELLLLQNRLDFSYDVSDDKLLNVLSLMSQSVGSLRRYHGLKKVKPVADIIRNELLYQEYEKIIIFGIHTDVLELLAKELAEFGVVMITGKTPAKFRQAYIDEFQTNSATQIFIGNINAAGVSITLTAANQVAFIEQDWVPGNNRQAADRAHRYGQSQAVTCRHFAIRNSVDEKITATLTRKIQELSTFID